MKNKILNLTAILIIVGPMPALADPVVIGDKEWRQVADTIGFTYGEIATVCNAGTGECSGSIGSVDFSGWTWANVSEVGELFSAITPHQAGGLDNISVFGPVVQPWIDDWFALFSPTFSTPPPPTGDGNTWTLGMTRDAYAPHVQKLFRSGQWESHAWTIYTFLGLVPQQGVWLHRETAISDDDGDSVPNDDDLCPGTAMGDSVDVNGCSDAQLDDDGDGVSNADDLCPGTAMGDSVDASGCSAAQQQTKVTTLIDDAINLIDGLGLDSFTTATLLQKLQEAQDKFDLGDLPDTRSKVCDFVGELEAAVNASSLSTDDANLLLKKAGTILGEISFP